MDQYEVISIDMFQTLVDVNKRIPAIWEKILKEQYTYELAWKGAEQVLACFPGIYKDACKEFQTMEEVYVRCMEEVKKRFSYPVTANEAAKAVMYEHGFAPVYQDVAECLPILTKKSNVVICSDSNHLMVDQLLSEMDVKHVFISDDLKAYKGDNRGIFFEKVLAKLGVAPERVLHIGDGAGDVIGAKMAGMKACWINREQAAWRNDVKPDYEIASFHDLLAKLKE